ASQIPKCESMMPSAHCQPASVRGDHTVARVAAEIGHQLAAGQGAVEGVKGNSISPNHRALISIGAELQPRRLQRHSAGALPLAQVTANNFLLLASTEQKVALGTEYDGACLFLVAAQRLGRAGLRIAQQDFARSRGEGERSAARMPGDAVHPGAAAGG